MKAFEESLRKVGAYVLEEWAMMMVDPSEFSADVFDPQHGLYVAEVAYRGVFDGRLTLTCQSPFLENLARNVLGGEVTEGDVAEVIKEDSLRELANVVSGNFLVDAFGDTTVFDLPELHVCRKDYEQASSDLGKESVCYIGDGAPIVVQFKIGE